MKIQIAVLIISLTSMLSCEGQVKPINETQKRKYVSFEEQQKQEMSQDKAVKTKEDLVAVLKANKEGAIMIEGTYPGLHGVIYYGFGI